MVENDSAIQTFCHWQNVPGFSVAQQNTVPVQYSIFPFILVHSSSFFYFTATSAPTLENEAILMAGPVIHGSTFLPPLQYCMVIDSQRPKLATGV